MSGLHLQFGKNAGTEVVVSWHTTDAVRNPRVMLGTPTSGFGSTVAAETRTYRDAKSGTEVRVNHARLTNLTPDTDYVYAAVHDGTDPGAGTVRTAPAGRKPLRFTSFGDQSTPTLEKLRRRQIRHRQYRLARGRDTTLAIERLAPLFNLVNGDLCYANLAADRIRTWSNWFENNTRSARYRPWMPAAGNHENELGNGPIGYGAYQTYFALPDSGSIPRPAACGTRSPPARCGWSASTTTTSPSRTAATSTCTATRLASKSVGLQPNSPMHGAIRMSIGSSFACIRRRSPPPTKQRRRPGDP